MRNLFSKFSILMLLSLPLASCQWVQQWWQNAEIEETDPWSKSLLTYEVVFAGEYPDDLEKQLRRESQLVQRQEKHPVASLLALKRRATADLDNLRDFLKSRGYFDATLALTISSEEPYVVTIAIITGERYYIGDISLHNSRAGSLIQVPYNALKARLKIGDPVDSAKILALQKLLMLYLQEHSYPGAVVEEPVGKADHAQKTVEIHIHYDPGNFTHFGNHSVNGLQNLAASYVENRIGWKPGEPYEKWIVDDTERKLMDSGIFDSVHIQAEDPQQTPATLKINVVEAKPRSIGAGIRYFTAEGLGVKAFWRHYNFLGGGELVNTSLKVSPRMTQGLLAFTIPDVLAPEQQLTPSITGTSERTKAYTARTMELGLKLERPLTINLSVNLGTTLEVGKIQRINKTFRNRLLGIPIGLNYDNTDDTLNPESGMKGLFQLIPYIGTVGSESRMFLTRFHLSGYIPLSEGPDPCVLALWTHLGSILVKEAQNIPPNKRFYAGGNGSVRGYGFQLLGPLDENGLPLGGRSLTEVGAEGRFRFTETWGGVVFLEGGMVSQNRLPLTNSKFFWGTGLGVRYYSPLGPIRFDVAIPITKRRTAGSRRLDNAYQLYISVGQAF